MEAVALLKNELFTIYEGTRTKQSVEDNDDDLQGGQFGDEETVDRIVARRVAGRFTSEPNYANIDTVKRPRVHFPYGTQVTSESRVKRDKTGMIYVVQDVITTDTAGNDVIVSLAD